MITQLAAFGNLFGPDLLILGGLVLLTTVFWVWALVDCLLNKTLGDTEKIVWVLVLLLSHIVGTVLYFLLARRGRTGPADV